MTAVRIRELTKSFHGGKRTALNRISADIPKAKITGIVGPDGAGKTTLIRILAGMMTIDSGTCEVFGHSTQDHPEKIQENLGYLPQKFGLYEDLTVSQNLSLYAKLQGVSMDDPVFDRLMEFSGLKPFQNRLAGALSGGMKQKLGLMATLLRQPQLLLLDEPTMGVDPISQKELWKMVLELNEKGMTVVLCTSYLDEAEKCDNTLLLNEGEILYSGTPDTFKDSVNGKTFYFEEVGDIKRTILDELIGKEGIIDTIVEGDKIRVTFQEKNPDQDPKKYGLSGNTSLKPRKAHYEDAFISALGGVPKRPALKIERKFAAENDAGFTVEAKGLTRLFGDFKAVDDISFQVKKGEIFGLLGPNGAGKSTTFKMLCGILRPTEGEALVGGISLREAYSESRSLIGYMAQKFSLYDNMTVMQNLTFYAGIYPVEHPSKTIAEMVEVFDLEEYRNTLALDLPLGHKQRLALSCSLMHRPEVIFLDEPTSGVDPLTRREFWHQINLLAASGVSVLVSTHLMDEAEYCDRIGLIFKGSLRVVDSPMGLKEQVPSEIAEEPGLVDAFEHFCSEEKHEGMKR